MDKRLVWQGYTTHNLDEAALAFSLRTKTQPEFFAARENWQCAGNEEYKSKVVYTDIVPSLGVYIPLVLKLEQFLEIVSAWTEKHSTAPSRFEAREQEEENTEYSEVTTYCNYCGRLYVPGKEITHCGLSSCAERYDIFKAQAGEIKKLYKMQDETAQQKKPDEVVQVSDDFELDDLKRTSLFGWIYFIVADNGLVKIGRSDNVIKRFNNIKLISPLHLDIAHVVATSNCVSSENWLHSEFSLRRHHGEWFALSREELEWVKMLSDFSLDRV